MTSLMTNWLWKVQGAQWLWVRRFVPTGAESAVAEVGRVFYTQASGIRRKIPHFVKTGGYGRFIVWEESSTAAASIPKGWRLRGACVSIKGVPEEALVRIFTIQDMWWGKGP